jgi:hypothetical protein
MRTEMRLRERRMREGEGGERRLEGKGRRRMNLLLMERFTVRALCLSTNLPFQSHQPFISFINYSFKVTAS